MSLVLKGQVQVVSEEGCHRRSRTGGRTHGALMGKDDICLAPRRKQPWPLAPSGPILATLKAEGINPTASVTSRGTTVC